jgi:hypothetical protein
MNICSFELCAATLQGVVGWATGNMAWPGNTLRFKAFEDRAAYAIDTASAQSMQALLNAANGGIVLETWIYVNKFLTFSRAYARLVGIANRDKFFGLQASVGMNVGVLGFRL